MALRRQARGTRSCRRSRSRKRCWHFLFHRNHGRSTRKRCWHHFLLHRNRHGRRAHAAQSSRCSIHWNGLRVQPKHLYQISTCLRALTCHLHNGIKILRVAPLQSSAGRCGRRCRSRSAGHGSIQGTRRSGFLVLVPEAIVFLHVCFGELGQLTRILLLLSKQYDIQESQRSCFSRELEKQRNQTENRTILIFLGGGVSLSATQTAQCIAAVHRGLRKWRRHDRCSRSCLLNWKGHTLLSTSRQGWLHSCSWRSCLLQAFGHTLRQHRYSRCCWSWHRCSWGWHNRRSRRHKNSRCCWGWQDRPHRSYLLKWIGHTLLGRLLNRFRHGRLHRCSWTSCLLKWLGHTLLRQRCSRSCWGWHRCSRRHGCSRGTGTAGAVGTGRTGAAGAACSSGRGTLCWVVC